MHDILTLKEYFCGGEYLQNILFYRKWCHHGTGFEQFISEHVYPKVPYGELDYDSIVDSPEFIDRLTKWIPNRFHFACTMLLQDLNKCKVTESTWEINRVIRCPSADIDSLFSKPKYYGKYWSAGIVPAPWGIGESVVNDTTVWITANAQTKDINWLETVRSRMDFDNGDDEHEIQLFEGTILPDFTYSTIAR